MIESGVLGQCLTLFRAYPFNNLLHGHVTSLIMHALGSAHPPLIAHLLGPCDLLPWLFTAPALVSLDGTPTLELAGEDQVVHAHIALCALLLKASAHVSFHDVPTSICSW